MSSRIYSFLSSLARPIISSVTFSKSMKSLDVKVVEATKNPLNVLNNMKHTMTQKKIMSFDEYKKQKMETVEEYKAYVKPAFPEFSDAKHERLYDEHCHAMYRRYVRITNNPANDPGRMI